MNMGRNIPTTHIHFNPPNPEINKIMDCLNKYPVVNVKPRDAQSFARCTKIRYLSKNKCIFIKKGTISIPRQTKLNKTLKGYSFTFRI